MVTSKVIYFRRRPWVDSDSKEVNKNMVYNLYNIERERENYFKLNIDQYDHIPRTEMTLVLLGKCLILKV